MMLMEPEGSPLLGVEVETDAFDHVTAPVHRLPLLPINLSDASYRAIVENAPDAIITTTVDGQISTVNRVAEQMFGYPAQEIIGQPLTCLLPERDRERLLVAFDHLLGPNSRQESHHSWVSSGLRRDELEFPIELRIADVDNGSCQFVIAVVRDATTRVRHEEQLAHRAFHDSLTGLPNRSLFMDRLEHALERAARAGNEVAVIFVDLNKLKMVNDTYGHQAGDVLLVEVGRRIAGCLRPDDTVARISGDEFTILLEDVHGIQEAARTAERIIEALAEPIEFESSAFQPSASLGVALSGRSNLTPAELLRRADSAMYGAKRSDDMRFNIYQPRPLRWLSQLDRLIERSIDTFRLSYRPSIDLHTGDIRGYGLLGALLGYQGRPEPTLLRDALPDIDREEIGLIAALIQQMARQAVGQIREWTPEGATTPPLLEVNLPVGFLEERDLAEQLTNLLQAERFTNDRFSIGFDEVGLLTAGKPGIDALKKLRQSGFRLRLDHFGAGQGSIRWLRQLPIDVVTLDQSLVDPARLDRREVPFLASLVSLIQSLGICVAAEGNGDSDDVRLVRELGCDFLRLSPASGAFSTTELTRRLASGAPLVNLD